MSRIQQYTLGSQSLKVASGLMLTAHSALANLEVIDISAFGGDYTISFGDDRTVDINLNFTGSTDTNDYIRIRDRTGLGIFYFAGFFGGDAGFGYPNATQYARGSQIDGTTDTGSNVAYPVNGGNNVGAWVADAADVAVGFHTGDNRFGFINVNWTASTKTLEVLG